MKASTKTRGPRRSDIKPEVNNQLAQQEEELSAEDKFFRLLTHYPFLTRYWTRPVEAKKGVRRKKAKCDSEALRRAALSSGERVIAITMLSIWDRSGVDLVDYTDLGKLEMHLKKPLIKWLIEPFWV